VNRETIVGPTNVIGVYGYSVVELRLCGASTLSQPLADAPIVVPPLLEDTVRELD
jgi:hypothetical protein